MRIWPPNAAKCCKNAGKFFPDENTFNRYYYKTDNSPLYAAALILYLARYIRYIK